MPDPKATTAETESNQPDTSEVEAALRDAGVEPLLGTVGTYAGPYVINSHELPKGPAANYIDQGIVSASGTVWSQSPDGDWTGAGQPWMLHQNPAQTVAYRQANFQ